VNVCHSFYLKNERSLVSYNLNICLIMSLCIYFSFILRFYQFFSAKNIARKGYPQFVKVLSPCKYVCFIPASFVFQNHLLTRPVYETRDIWWSEDLNAIRNRWREPLKLLLVGCPWGRLRRCTLYPNQFYIDTASMASRYEYLTRCVTRHTRIFSEF